jgi:hypothetical protein
VGIFHLDLVALWSGLRQNVRGLLGPGLGLTFETYIGLGFGLASEAYLRLRYGLMSWGPDGLGLSDLIRQIYDPTAIPQFLYQDDYGNFLSLKE